MSWWCFSPNRCSGDVAGRRAKARRAASGNWRYPAWRASSGSPCRDATWLDLHWCERRAVRSATSRLGPLAAIVVGPPGESRPPRPPRARRALRLALPLDRDGLRVPRPPPTSFLGPAVFDRRELLVSCPSSSAEDRWPAGSWPAIPRRSGMRPAQSGPPRRHRTWQGRSGSAAAHHQQACRRGLRARPNRDNGHKPRARPPIAPKSDLSSWASQLVRRTRNVSRPLGRREGPGR
jgi:hypothetical protein